MSTKYCSNCSKPLDGKSYTCKLCDTQVCPDCLASGKLFGTKKCKRCCGLIPDQASSPQKKNRPASAAKSSTPQTTSNTPASTPQKDTAPATGGDMPPAVDTAAEAARKKEIAEARKAAAQNSKIGNMLRVGSTFDANQGGMLDMNDTTMKFGWDLYALLNVKVIEASGLPAADVNVIGANSSDPYAVITLLEDKVTRKTKICKQTLSPVWNFECTTMVVDVPCQKMEVQVYDYDMTSDDDLLGTAYLDLTNLIPGQPANGWLPLTNEGKPAGAIHLELEIMYTPGSERIAYIQEAMVPRPKPKPKFDINALYGPGMFMAHVLWLDTLQPFIKDHVLPILMWDNWLLSAVALIGFIYSSYYAAYWPAIACWALAVAMLRNKFLKGYERFMQNKTLTSTLDASGNVILLDSDDDDNSEPQEESFNGLVKTFTKLSPGWVKDMAAGFQPLVRTLADVVGEIREIILWKHKASQPVFYTLLAAGIVLCFIPFWIVIMLVGAVILVVNSPLKGLSIGLAKYAARPTPTGDVGLLDAMEEFHMSDEFRKQAAKKQRKQQK
ncbi:extended synaptotagmin-like protein [Perkinsus chesapeaki]|uniref:Extended synaptotagmin-like protein n=1 Tax=Perkinsus chesapeaki TaxID=330153 RepID=A0A7J6M5Y2_PERCH|nr:extended synaptotagmin-like protein [Perkinsus chesapeaki]